MGNKSFRRHRVHSDTSERIGGTSVLSQSEGHPHGYRYSTPTEEVLPHLLQAKTVNLNEADTVMRVGMLPALLAAFVVLSIPASQAGIRQADSVCPVSDPVKDRPPNDPHASSFASPNATWYANDDRTLWAWWWGKRSSGDYKVLWVRPTGAILNISGRRLDAEAPALTAHIPTGYRHTFQASAIDFPSAGCWEIEATADDERLKFVVRVR